MLLPQFLLQFTATMMADFSCPYHNIAVFMDHNCYFHIVIIITIIFEIILSSLSSSKITFPPSALNIFLHLLLCLLFLHISFFWTRSRKSSFLSLLFQSLYLSRGILTIDHRKFFLRLWNDFYGFLRIWRKANPTITWRIRIFLNTVHTEQIIYLLK